MDEKIKLRNLEIAHNVELLSCEEKTDTYYYVFHGGIPSILAACVVYRSIGNRNSYGHINRKTIKCPYCSKVLTEVDRDTKVELFRHPLRKKIRCQAYPICPSCKIEVGIIIA